MDKFLEKYMEMFVKEAGPLPRITVKTPKVRTKTTPKGTSKATPKLTPKAQQAALMTKVFQGIKFDKAGKLVFPEEFWKLSSGSKFKLLQAAYRRKTIKQKLNRKKNFAKLTQKYTRQIQGSMVNAAVKIFSTLNPLNFTAKKALATSIGLAVLYKYFSGKSPSGSSKETARIVSDVSNISNKLPIDEIVKLIEEARANTEEPEIITMLNNLSTALESVKRAQLNLDNPTNALTYSESIKDLESVASEFLANDHSDEFEQLSLALSEMVFTIDDARSAIASMMQRSIANASCNMGQLYTYSDYYYDVIVKKSGWALAVQAAFILVPLISAYISNSSAQINETKDVLKDLSELMKDQLEGGWFADEEKTKQYTPLFKEYDGQLNSTINLMDQMLNPPKGADDTSQITNIDKFISSAENVLVKSSEVSGALTEMQGVAAKAGTFLSGLGFNITDLSRFNSKIAKISGSLSLFVSKLKKDKEVLEVKAEKQATDAEKQSTETETEKLTPVSEDFYKNMADIEL